VGIRDHNANKQDGVPLIGEDRSGADEKIAVLHIKLGELRRLQGSKSIKVFL
jgi:hypothetical protein